MLHILLIVFIVSFLWNLIPSKEDRMYRDQVHRARDEFYLREAEKNRSSSN